MAARASHCNQDQLKRLLEGALSAAAADDLTEHVEDCDTCRQQMETLAGDESWWVHAHLFLSDDEVVLASDLPTTGNTIQLNAISAEIDTTPDELVIDFLDQSDNPAMLGRLGGYEVLEVIGRGGMGIVLKAYDAELNRYVAIKVLAPHYASSAAARQRFAREAQAAAAVVHQHVVGIHAVDASDKLPYLVMPYVACESLQERLDRQGPLDIKDTLRIGMQAAEGLAAAHAQGLVHRDVKPANILLEKGVDRVLLTDFGLARAIDDAALTRSGIIAGTPQYMSPEQAKGEAIDHRTDLFSLGSVLYAMCTSRPPFRAETTMGILRRICDGEARPVREVNSEVPSWLAAIIERLLTKSKEARYESAEEVASLLEKCLAHVQHPTAVSLPASLNAAEKRKPRFYAVAGALVAILAVVLASVFANLNVGRPPSTPASSNSSQTTTNSQSADPSKLGWDDEIDSELFRIESELEMLNLMNEM
jgi:serine/threonine-protein kinase